MSRPPGRATRKGQLSESIFSRTCEKSPEDIEIKLFFSQKNPCFPLDYKKINNWLLFIVHKKNHNESVSVGSRALLRHSIGEGPCFMSQNPLVLGTERKSCWASPRDGHQGFIAMSSYKQNGVALIRQHSFIVNCEQPGLSNLFFFEGQDLVSTVKFTSHNPYH